MKSLALKDGDLVLSGSRLKTVEGQDKLMQDLGAWVLYPMGASPTAPTFGSTLGELVGSDPAEAETQAVSEINRVLANYEATQLAAIQDAAVGGTIGYWARSEILAKVGDIVIQVQPMALQITVPVTAYSGAVQQMLAVASALAGQAA